MDFKIGAALSQPCRSQFLMKLCKRLSYTGKVGRHRSTKVASLGDVKDSHLCEYLPRHFLIEVGDARRTLCSAHSLFRQRCRVDFLESAEQERSGQLIERLR